MRISYNSDVDIMYVSLHAEIAEGETPITPPPAPIHITEWFRVHLGYDGEPTGIEIEGASRHVGLESVLVTDLPLAGPANNNQSIASLGLVTMDEFATLAGVKTSTLRDHRNKTSKSPLPEPALRVGTAPLWRRRDALAWIARRDRNPGRAKKVGRQPGSAVG